MKCENPHLCDKKKYCVFFDRIKGALVFLKIDLLQNFQSSMQLQQIRNTQKLFFVPTQKSVLKWLVIEMFIVQQFNFFHCSSDNQDERNKTVLKFELSFKVLK